MKARDVVKIWARAVFVALALGLVLGCAELTSLREIKDAQDRYIRELEDQSKSYKDAYYKVVEQRNKEQEQFNARIFKLEREIERTKAEQLEKEKDLLQKNQDLRLSLEMKMKEIAEKEAAHRAAVKGKDEQISGLKDKNKALERERLEAVKTLDQLSSEVTRLQGQVDSMLVEVRGKDEAAARKDQEIAAKDKQLKEMAQSLEAASQEREALSSREKELEQKIQQLNEKLGAASSDAVERGKTIEEMGRLRKELEELRKGGGKPDPQLDEAYGKLESSLAGVTKSGEVTLKKDARGLVVIVQNDVLFQPESVILKPEAKELLSRISGVMSEYKDRLVSVGGYTDNQPIENLPFYDNLALASARADNVTRYLIEEGKIPPSELRSVSGGEYYPIAPNNSPEGRKQNRRVEIILSRK
jgi:flagellar motor protein MotB